MLESPGAETPGLCAFLSHSLDTAVHEQGFPRECHKAPTAPQKQVHPAAPLQLMTSATYSVQTPTEFSTLPRRQGKACWCLHRNTHHIPSPAYNSATNPSPRGLKCFLT